MRLPIDTSKMTFITAADPRPVLDFESRQPRVDGQGRPLFSVRVFASGDEIGQVIEVKTAGEPAGVTRNMPVKVSGLTVQPWTLKNGKSGVAYRAAAITPATAAGKAS
jgi:hypothetical protein